MMAIGNARIECRGVGLETEIVVAALSGLEHRVLLSVWPGPAGRPI
jgi:hypothetical protein